MMRDSDETAVSKAAMTSSVAMAAMTAMDGQEPGGRIVGLGHDVFSCRRGNGLMLHYRASGGKPSWK